MQNSNSAHSPKRVVVDIDQSGYQLAAAFTGKHSETVAMFLNSGNSHCTDHYNDLLKSIISKYKDQLSNYNLILRTDSGFGSADSVEKLLSIPNLKFVTKGYSTKTASNLEKDIDYAEYIQTDKAAWIYELP